MSKRYYNPTEVITGVGSFAEVGKAAARFGTKALVIRSPSAPNPAGSLEAAGLEVVAFEPFSGEPTLAHAKAALELARTEAVEVVVSVGGGSPIDAGKATAGLYPHAGAVRDYHTGGREVPGGGLPFIAIPTTAGAGAEVTKNAVLSDPENDIKKSIRHDAWFPRAAILDPELTYSVPPEVTAGSGGDALCQAVESYVSIGATPVTDALAYEAAKRIGPALPVAYREPENAQARADMLYGSTLAGLALSNARLGGVHGIAHPLGVRFGIPHGVVCGLLLPYEMQYNLGYADVKYANLARAWGLEAAAQAAIDEVFRILEAVELPLHLRDVGVEQDAFPLIVEESLPSGSLKHNPRPLGADDVMAILRAAW